MNKFIFLFLLLVSGFTYSKCIPLTDNNEEYKRLFKMSYMNLRGDNKGIAENLNHGEGYYDNYAKGYMYLVGKNTLKDYTLAEKYLLKSAQYCFSPAHYSLGYLYYLQGNTEKAMKWFLSARELGDNLAAHQLAIMYKKENKPEEMLENLLFADSHDFTPSITELGVQYYDGSLLKKDLNKAFIFFERAALRNDPLAQNNVGWMYEHGEGTQKDIDKAKYWYQIALDNGYELANQNLKRVNVAAKSNGGSI